MEKIEVTRRRLQDGASDPLLATLYGVKDDALIPHRARLAAAAESFSRMFGRDEAALFSVPGRTELGGNHTDHQHGNVLAAAVSMDIVAAAAPNGTDVIRVQSEGYPLDEISLTVTTPVPAEQNTAAALIRGVAARFLQLGYPVRGMDVYTTSTVRKGSGLSSSAAFEVLIANLCNHFFADGKEDAVSLAKIGQYAENVYFGKPCGLMDQMAASVGGVVHINFADPARPVIEQLSFDPAAAGYALCIIDSGADHADLTDAYAAIPAEMSAVAHQLGVQVLADAAAAQFFCVLPRLREQCGDRAVLRAMHFFDDDARVVRQAALLRDGDVAAFLREMTASGKSSFCCLQNIFDTRTPHRQAVSVALALCEHLLGDTGAYRVHGGGFAGTVQAFVPLSGLPLFRTRIESILGTGSCEVLQLRPVGGVHII